MPTRTSGRESLPLPDPPFNGTLGRTGLDPEVERRLHARFTAGKDY